MADLLLYYVLDVNIHNGEIMVLLRHTLQYNLLYQSIK